MDFTMFPKRPHHKVMQPHGDQDCGACGWEQALGVLRTHPYLLRGSTLVVPPRLSPNCPQNPGALFAWLHTRPSLTALTRLIQLVLRPCRGWTQIQAAKPNDFASLFTQSGVRKRRNTVVWLFGHVWKVQSRNWSEMRGGTDLLLNFPRSLPPFLPSPGLLPLSVGVVHGFESVFTV